jgi:hypothetical protein
MYKKTGNRYAVHRTGYKVNGEGCTEVNATFACLPHTLHRVPFTLHHSPCTVHRSPHTGYRSSRTGTERAVSPPLVSCTEQVKKATVWLHSL